MSAWVWNIKPWIWRHLASATRTADTLHAVGALLRAAAARWRQSQGLRLRRSPTPSRIPLEIHVLIGGVRQLCQTFALAVALFLFKNLVVYHMPNNGSWGNSAFRKLCEVVDASGSIITMITSVVLRFLYGRFHQIQMESRSDWKTVNDSSVVIGYWGFIKTSIKTWLKKSVLDSNSTRIHMHENPIYRIRDQ